MRFPSFIVKAFLFSLSVFMGMCLIELTLFLAGVKKGEAEWKWATDGSLFRIDRDFMYKTQPGTTTTYAGYTITVSEEGFRTNNLSPPEVDISEANPLRIVLIGDSFVWGHTASEETYSAQLEKILTHSLQRPVQVLNGGVSGYGSDHSLLHIQEVFESSPKPDLIVWNFNVNDFYDNVERPLFGIDQNERLFRLPTWKNGVYLQGIVSRLFRASHIPHTYTTSYILGRIQHLRFYSLGEVQYKWVWSKRKMVAAVKEAQLESKAIDIPLIFAISPSQAVIYDLPQNQKQKDELHDLRDLLSTQQFFVDQTDYFTQQLKNQESDESVFIDESSLFPKGEWHPNSKGNTWMAQSLLPTLAEVLFVSATSSATTSSEVTLH